jgi:hypothetical protein
MVIVLVLTISAKGELELVELEDDEVLEPPRLPAVVPPPPPVEVLEVDPVLVAAEVEALPVDPADTAFPGERLASDTMVPLVGA